MHPNHATDAPRDDPDAALERRLEVARTRGVPEEPLRRYGEAQARAAYGIAGIVEPDRDLLPGVEVDDRPRHWQVIETPGHAPSHVCLYQPERRLLISGDHLLGRVSLYYDYGWSPDPAGEFLASLDASRRSTRGSASPATGARSPTCRPTSRPTASSSPSASARSRTSLATTGR